MPCPRQRHPALSLVGLADPDGVSPLAWLLSEYLESVELPRRATGRRATFGSCVRRLTQLLVHVDPGGPEPEESRAAGEPGAALPWGWAGGAPECQAVAMGLLWAVSCGTGSSRAREGLWSCPGSGRASPAPPQPCCGRSVCGACPRSHTEPEVDPWQVGRRGRTRRCWPGLQRQWWRSREACGESRSAGVVWCSSR